MKKYTVHYSTTADPSEGFLLDDFSFPWIDRPCPPTRFRAVWSEKLFAFRFEVEDEDLVLDASDDAGEAVLGSDRVELFFASSRDLSTYYYGAEMDPRGGVYDYRATYHRQFDLSWHFPNLKLAGKVSDGGYSVEGSLPLADLRDMKCLVGDQMITGVYRAEFSHGKDGKVIQDWISWIRPSTETAEFHTPSSFGTFVFDPAP